MRIDLDSHATTRIDPRVLAAMNDCWYRIGGNASSVQHASGRAARDAVERAREQIAAAIGCDPRELVFTSGATEANNLALRGVCEALGPETHVVTNVAEHRAVLDPVRRLARTGFPVTLVEVDAEGRVPLNAIVKSLREDSRLISVMLASNEVGVINDVADIVGIAESWGILMHTDASQAVGKIPVNVDELGVDLMSFTAHKLHGPQGVGALYVRRDGGRIPLVPLIEGGGHERGLRSGTLPVALIVGFGEAVAIAVGVMQDAATRMASFRDRLWSRLRDIPGILWNGPPPAERLPHNLNVSFEGIDGEALLVRVDQRGLNVSSGAACSSTNPEPSHVLRAMGLSEQLARASLRFGLSRFTTQEEVDRAALIVSDSVASLRQA